MGLWLKQGDDLVPVSGGGGGSFEGEHVLTGDPLDPPEELQVGQLLYDGDPSTGGGGPHDHDDYLPLEGGTLTGDLQVNGQMTTLNGTASTPTYSFWNDRTVGLYLINAGVAGFTGSLQVDGQIRAANGDAATPSIHFKNSPDTGFFRNSPGKIRMAAGGVHVQDVSASQTTIKTDLKVDGDVFADSRIKSEYTRDNPTASGATNVHLSDNGYFYKTTLTRGGPFTPSKLARSEDVLVKAETATLPPEMETDDGGNILNTAEIEAHDTVQLFDVVTALLAKVKELTATVADQAEKIAALEAS